MDFAVVIALAAVLIIWALLTRKTRTEKLLEPIPGKRGWPIIGNALDFMFTHKLIPSLFEYTDNPKGIAKVKIGFHYIVVVSNYRALEYIFSSTRINDKSFEYTYFIPWLGTGLLTSGGNKWKIHRKMITPAFHFKILEQFVDVFEAVGNVFVEKLAQAAKTSPSSIDVYPFVTLCALDIICETAMGTKVNAQDNAESAYVRGVKDLCRIIIERSMSPVKMNDFLFSLSKDYREYKAALRVVHSYTESIIKKRMQERDNKVKSADTKDGIKRKKAFLDLLLEAELGGHKFSFEEIREEVDTFMFEGHDTTASAISFTLFCLANHPEVQKRAVEEQRFLYGNEQNPAEVTYTNLQEMKYLENVIKESLRMYPSVPFYGRKITEDVEFDGITLPKGVSVTLFAQGIHMNPAFYPEPDAFLPDRFANLDPSRPYAYVPFSAGARNCIGQKFAMLEMKSTVSKVLRNFELFPADPKHEVRLVAEAILKSTTGVRVGLRGRSAL